MTDEIALLLSFEAETEEVVIMGEPPLRVLGWSKLIEKIRLLPHLIGKIRLLPHLIEKSEATEEVVIKDESPLRDLGWAKLIEKIRLLPHLIEKIRLLKHLIEKSEAETEEVVIKVESPPSDLIFKFNHLSELAKQNPKGNWSDQRLALLIPVMGLFAGAAYLVLFSFHEAFPISATFKNVNLSTWELLTFPRAATGDFLVNTTVTTTFILSIGINTIAVCFYFRKFVWGTFLTILSLFAIAAVSLSFFAMLAKFLPHHITIDGGNLKVPASFIVIFYDIYVIILVCAFAYTIQWWRSSRRKQDADVEHKSVV